MSDEILYLFGDVSLVAESPGHGGPALQGFMIPPLGLSTRRGRQLLRADFSQSGDVCARGCVSASAS